jgi:hypothetical protein
MDVLRMVLRCATLLLLAAAALSLAALSEEYPGSSVAGRQVVVREVLPLAVLAWLHLEALDARQRRHRRWWAAVAALGDAALLARGVARAWPGGVPLTLAVTVIAALLFAGTIGVAWRDRKPAGDLRAAS